MQLGFDLQSGPAPEPAPKIFRVTELTRLLRSLIEERVGQAWVEGEISNYRRQSSGHHYFTLKDETSQLSCVLFAGAAAALRDLKLADGQQVQVFGELTVYEARGQYQMVVRNVKNRGEGALQVKFEALKQKLSAEGLFAMERKRAVPRFPRRVGVVTSPTGAALRDFLSVLHRRHPGIEVLINPVRVQGSGASREIAAAIEQLGEAARYGWEPVDVIVVTRGGGSIEDLWEFNEEIVARAIAASPIPVLSAIGHEIDFTIADFVADLRAPTPSAAAEILAADRLEALAWLRQQEQRLDHTANNRLELLESRIGSLSNASALREPLRRVTELRQTLDQEAGELTYMIESVLENSRHALHRLATRIQSPVERLEKSRLNARWLAQRLTDALAHDIAPRRARLEHFESNLATLSPERTLARGYTLTLDKQGHPIISAKKVGPGKVLRTRFTDGEVESVATER